MAIPIKRKWKETYIAMNEMEKEMFSILTRILAIKSCYLAAMWVQKKTSNIKDDFRTISKQELKHQDFDMHSPHKI